MATTIPNHVTPDLAARLTPPTVTKARPARDLHVYATRGGVWRWKLLSPNGQVVIATSGQSYRRREYAVGAARRLIRFFTDPVGGGIQLVVLNTDGTDHSHDFIL